MELVFYLLTGFLGICQVPVMVNLLVSCDRLPGECFVERASASLSPQLFRPQLLGYSGLTCLVLAIERSQHLLIDQLAERSRSQLPCDNAFHFDIPPIRATDSNRSPSKQFSSLDSTLEPAFHA